MRNEIKKQKTKNKMYLRGGKITIVTELGDPDLT